MSDDKTALEMRCDQKFDEPSICFLQHWFSTSQLQRKTGQEYISSFWTHIPRTREGDWRELMIAVFEDLQKSEVSDFYVQKIHKPRSNRNARTRISVWKPVKLPNRPRPSLIAEENIDLEDDIEIEEDKNWRTTEDSSSMSGEFMNDIMKNIIWSFTTQIMKHSRSHWNTWTWWDKIRQV